MVCLTHVDITIFCGLLCYLWKPETSASGSGRSACCQHDVIIIIVQSVVCNYLHIYLIAMIFLWHLYFTIWVTRRIQSGPIKSKLLDFWHNCKNYHWRRGGGKERAIFIRKFKPVKIFNKKFKLKISAFWKNLGTVLNFWLRTHNLFCRNFAPVYRKIATFSLPTFLTHDAFNKHLFICKTVLSI